MEKRPGKALTSFKIFRCTWKKNPWKLRKYIHLFCVKTLKIKIIWLDELFSWGSLTNSAWINKPCQSNITWIYTKRVMSWDYWPILAVTLTSRISPSFWTGNQLTFWTLITQCSLSTNNWGWNNLSANFGCPPTANPRLNIHPWSH